jgi:hypothetical protein
MAIDHFFSMNQQGLYLLNQGFLCLYQRRNAISIIHNFAKIISKILANRLAPELKNQVSASQTTFIKSRCIHDSFAYVHGVVKLLQKINRPLPFSLNWIFLRPLTQSTGHTSLISCVT